VKPETRCTLALLLVGVASALHVFMITAGWLDHWWRGPLMALPYFVAFRMVNHSHRDES
jgi:ABC-type multidrug transport system permease subunit